MPGPIYKLFLGRPKEAWYQLSKQEQDTVLAEYGKATTYKPIIWCDATAFSDEWVWFGVEEYADLAALEKAAKADGDAKLRRYVEGISVLGAKVSDE
jgi:hypothetical protein